MADEKPIGADGARPTPNAPLASSIPPAFLQTVARAEQQQHEKGLDVGASIVPDRDQEILATAAATAHIPLEEVSRNGRKVTFDDNGDIQLGEPSQGGAYEVIKVLGRGGMGVVCAARQASLQREVALKIARKTASGTQGTTRADLEMFTNEAFVTGSLDHPNVVPVHTLAKDASGRLFFTMKQVSGICWEHLLSPALIRNRKDRAGVEERAAKMSLEDHLKILLSVCDALAYAHDKGFLHRDVKPENVMIGSYGEVLLMDWGLAMPFGERNPYILDPTLVAQLVGTPAYLAPEMARGKMTRFAPPTDVYLVGATLYRILTGRPPHWGEGVVGAVNKAASGKIDPMDQVAPKRQIDPEITRITLKALAAPMADRYQSIKDFQQDLRLYLAHNEALAIARNATATLHQAQAMLTRGGKKKADEGGQAITSLDKASAAEVYGRLSECIGAFLQSINLWSENEDAQQGLRTALLLQIRLAMHQGDLTLARSRIELLDAACPEGAAPEWVADVRRQQAALGDELTVLEARQAAIARREKFQRLLVFTIIILLLLGIGGGFYLITQQKSLALDNLRTTEERNQVAQQSLRLSEQMQMQSFAQAVSARAALLDRYLIDIQDLVDLYGREAQRLMALDPRMLERLTKTPAGREGYYLDEDYYDPKLRPADMTPHPVFGVPMSQSHPTFKLAPWAGRGAARAKSLASIDWLVRLGRLFAQVHQTRSDILYSVAGTATGVLMTFPGSGRFRDKPEYDPTKRPWYQSALRSGPVRAPRWVDPHVDAGGQGLLLTCVSALLRGEQVRGVIGVEVSMEKLQAILLEHTSQAGEGARGLLIRPDERIMVDTRYTADPRKWESKFKLDTVADLEPELASYIRGAQSGQLDASKVLKVQTGQGHSLFSHSPLNDTGWLLVLTAPWQTR